MAGTDAKPTAGISLRTRLLLGCLSPLLAAALCQAVFTIFAERQAAIAGLEEKARSLAALMVNVVGPDIALGDPASAQHSLAYIDKDADFAFSAVMTPDGKIPAFSGSDEVKNDVTRQLMVVSDPQLIRQDHILIALYPLKPGTREIGTVAVGMATAKVQATVTRMVVKTIAIAAVGIGITLIVILLLSSAVVRRNRDLKLIMDNVEQGFLSVTREGILLPEHSTILLSWFGPWQPGKHLWEYLQTMAPKYGETVQWLWENVTGDVLPIDMALEQIPSTIESGGRTFRFVYKPIFDGETLLNVLIVVSDISAEIEQEKSKGEQRELVGIFQWLLKDKNGLVDFFADADRLVHDLTKGPVKDFVTVKRDVHTLKGNCGIFGLQSVVAVCQEIENHFEEGGTDMSIADATKLTAIWQAAQDKRSQLFAGDDLKQISIEATEQSALLEAILKHQPYDELANWVRRWTLEPAKQRFARIGEQAKGLAKRLNKGDINVLIEANNIRLPAHSLTHFWSNFIHLVRNAVDHGLETSEERIAAGKSAAGSIQLRAMVRSDQFIVEIEDDGRGVNWKKIAEKAAAAGQPSSTKEDLVEALFSDGISTKDAATEISGRGVGMSAVRASCAETGGKVKVFSEPGGTRFQFAWPASVLAEEETSVRRPAQIGPPSGISATPN